MDQLLKEVKCVNKNDAEKQNEKNRNMKIIKRGNGIKKRIKALYNVNKCGPIERKIRKL